MAPQLASRKQAGLVIPSLAVDAGKPDLVSRRLAVQALGRKKHRASLLPGAQWMAGDPKGSASSPGPHPTAAHVVTHIPWWSGTTLVPFGP
jgi:hypothetical protein